MLALVKQQTGYGHVALQDVPQPSPGPRQVRIRVEAAGVCGSDLHILRSDIKLNLRPPVVMGHEFSGAISDVGAAVEGLKPGDRVTSETTFCSCGACRHCRAGDYNLCAAKELIGYVHNGSFAQYCVVPAGMVHGLPESVSFEEGALCEPLACSVHAVMEQAKVQPSDTVVVAGPGPIGLLCAQVARAGGAGVIVSGKAADVERLRKAQELGIEKVVNIDAEDPEAAVKSATGGEGADVFLECSGAPSAAGLGIRLLRRAGRFCQVGLFGKPVELDFESVAYKELLVTGSIGSKRSSWEKALALLRAGNVNLRPMISTVLPLRDWNEAFRRVEAKEGLKILLRPE